MGKRSGFYVVRLDHLPEASLLNLLPGADIERIVGKALTWRVLQTQAEMINWDLSGYNACVSTHVQKRWMLNRYRANPLEAKFRFFGSRDYHKLFSYVHNQCAVEAATAIDGIVCAKIHLAVAANRYLYLHDIELANPNVIAASPLGPDQKFAGLGNGIFKDIIRRLRLFAGTHGLLAMVAYAADATRSAIFERQGFSLDASDPLVEAALCNGRQIPIRIDVL